MKTAKHDSTNSGRFDYLEQMSPAELNQLKVRVEQRLRSIYKKDGSSLMKSLSGKEQVELVVLAVKQNGIRCRILETGDPVTLRPSAGVRSEAEAHILTVGISKVWVYGKTTFLSGKVVRMRLDIPALKLVPLKLCGDNLWDPAEEYWGEQDEPMMGCLKPVIAAGPRPSFEMEQILPGMDPNDPDSDPIGRAVDLYEVGG